MGGRLRLKCLPSSFEDGSELSFLAFRSCVSNVVISERRFRRNWFSPNEAKYKSIGIEE